MLKRQMGLLGMAVCLAAGTPAAAPADRIYHIVFLKRDPARKPLSEEEGKRIQAAHMANILAMAERGVLVAAGPFGDKPSVISGVFFFATSTAEEARKIAEADPTVVERRNTVELLSWHGPVGLGEEYMRLHREKPDTPEDMGVHPFVILRRSDGAPDRGLMAKHSAYWAKLKADGKVLAAGAVDGDASAVGIVIFDRIPDEEAAALAKGDPSVAAGALSVEAHRWWSAAHVFPR
jgi:uncharacterized protein YciI